ncbi:MAG: BatA domain-containing protein [Haloarculaceae archaeon]
MAGLADVFLTPLGLTALAALVPLVLLYLVRPEPTRLRLPTLEFLAASDESGTDSPAFETLRRNLLLLIQALVVVAVALALASPYVTVGGTETVEETVVVLDASASTTVADAGGQSRFARAKTIAGEVATGTTSIVVARESPEVVLRRGSGEDALAALADVDVTEADGDLAAAITGAAAVAGREARIVVVSDFAGADGWRAAVETVRGRGYTVDVRQVGGQVANVGIVGAEYGRTDVTVSVKNYGEGEVERTVSLGGERERLTLAPGDVGTATLPVPTGNNELRLSPGDAFPLDDRLYVAGPDRARIRVLLLTNEENRYLRTALDVLEEVALTVERPPTSISEPYDVVVFSGIDGDRLLRSTRQQAADVAEGGGGVIVGAQGDLRSVGYGELLAVEPAGTASDPSLRLADDRLTRGIQFPPPEVYVETQLKEGAEAVVTADGSPFVARARLGDGRLLYYGYLQSDSAFHFHYQYPVFWKRAVYEAAGRETLAATNYPTGTRLSVPNGTTVETPEDAVTPDSGTATLSAVGFYRYGDRRVGASLLSETESNVSAPSLSTGPDGVVREREEQVPRPLDLSPVAAGGALLFVLVELSYLRWRGDL